MPPSHSPVMMGMVSRSPSCADTSWANRSGAIGRSPKAPGPESPPIFSPSELSHSLQIALPLESLLAGDWLPAESWQLYPDTDVFYAIAVSNTQAARAISRHVLKLPQKCTASIRAGLEDQHLQAWIAEFSQIADRWQSDIDWQSIRVRNVY